MWPPLFSFLCVCHLPDNSPSSPLAFPHSSYSYNTNNKDIHSREGGGTHRRSKLSRNRPMGTTEAGV